MQPDSPRRTVFAQSLSGGVKITIRRPTNWVLVAAAIVCVGAGLAAAVHAVEAVAVKYALGEGWTDIELLRLIAWQTVVLTVLAGLHVGLRGLEAIFRETMGPGPIEPREQEFEDIDWR